ncbi:MAG TPA: SRPBCC family protein, partial [Planctomycetaceae bacterium]|nr:SRPBCC family protein [Planctomycetaceae bacterium]
VRQVYDIPPVPIPDVTEIMSSRDLNFPREKVFAAFADPDCLKKWWGPAGFTNTFHEFDFRVGGHWRLTLYGPDAGNYENHAVFDDIVTPERISWHRLTNPLFQMTMTFAELPKQRTRLVWRMKFDTEDLRDKVAAFAVGKNEENFDRLITELKSRS